MRTLKVPGKSVSLAPVEANDAVLWGCGYGTEALTLLLDYGFNILSLRSVMLGVFSFNEQAIECYRKVGFREIGRRRQCRLVGGGQWHDGVLMDILSEEFQALHRSVLAIP